jgi:hypothetical protein
MIPTNDARKATTASPQPKIPLICTAAGGAIQGESGAPPMLRGVRGAATDDQGRASIFARAVSKLVNPNIATSLLALLPQFEGCPSLQALILIVFSIASGTGAGLLQSMVCPGEDKIVRRGGLRTWITRPRHPPARSSNGHHRIAIILPNKVLQMPSFNNFVLTRNGSSKKVSGSPPSERIAHEN